MFCVNSVEQKRVSCYDFTAVSSTLRARYDTFEWRSCDTCKVTWRHRSDHPPVLVRACVILAGSEWSLYMYRIIFRFYCLFSKNIMSVFLLTSIYAALLHVCSSLRCLVKSRARVYPCSKQWTREGVHYETNTQLGDVVIWLCMNARTSFYSNVANTSLLISSDPRRTRSRAKQLRNSPHQARHQGRHDVISGSGSEAGGRGGWKVSRSQNR